MANVKNFGLVGVASDVQFGKAGPRVVNNAGVFELKTVGGVDVALTTAGITSSAGNVTLTTGNLVLNDTTISRLAAGVTSISGTGALVIPSGTTGQEPTAATYAGGMRFNTSSNTMEYSNGTAWTTLATGGTAVTAVSVASANGFAGTSSGGTTPALTITTSVSGLLKGNGTAISAAVSGTDIKTVGGVSLIGSGDVGVIGAAYGGTGVDNTGKTITLGGNISTAGSFTTTGANALEIITTGATSVTFPTSGTLATVGGTVASFATGTTGLLANGLSTAQTGAVTLSGTLNAVNGGTGFASFSAGDILYASATDTWAHAAPGVTSGVQAYDAGLAALAAKTTTGIMVQTGNDTFTSVSLTAPAEGITISNADGTGGSPTFALANDLAAVEGLTTFGYAVRVSGTTTPVWATRTMTGTSGQITISNGDGVATNTDIGLATVTNPGNGGTFVKVTTDAYGRVSNSTAVVTSDITALVDSTYVNVTGDTMSGALAMGGNAITGLPAVQSSDSTSAASKAYVDAAVASLSVHAAVEAATTADLVGTYVAGVAGGSPDTGTGVGATFTMTATGVLVIDSYTLVAIGQRVLIKNQTTPQQNGIYVVSTVGAVGIATVFTRASDFDNSIYGDAKAGAFVYVQEGGQAGTGWTETTVGTQIPGDALKFGTDPVVFTQYSGAGTYSAGQGLALTGTVFSVKEGAGITNLPSGEVGIDVVSGVAVQLTGTATGDQLTFVLDTGSGLSQSGTGLKIAAGGVTNAMLANSSFTLNADSGSAPFHLGDTYKIIGTSGQGISTSLVADAGEWDLVITAANASSSQKGVASFATTDFVVTTGNVALGLVGVTKGGTGFSSYTVGDMLYADTTTSLAKLADVATGNVLLSGGVGAAPSYGKVSLTAAVSGILPAANGGTGVANSNTITLGGNISTAGALTTSGAFGSTFTMTGTTNVTFPTSGTLATTAGTVASFSAGTTGLTPNSATTGAVTLGGTLVVANGGTGVATLGANQVMLGNGTGAVLTSSALAFSSNTLTVGSATIFGDTVNTTITATGANGSLILTPTGTGTVQIGPSGAGLIQSDPSSSLTVVGTTVLNLNSTTGNTTMNLGSSGAYVSVLDSTADASGATYAAAIAAAPTALTNKYYVDAAITAAQTTDAPTEVHAIQATVSLATNGTTNIGSLLPAGVTILSVKVKVTVADLAATLSVGKSGSVAAYMATTENDPQTIGLYMAECDVDEAGAVQVIATVAASATTSGATCKVVVTYQVN